MDDLSKYNKERWEELAEAGVEFSQPMLDLDEDSARSLVDAQGIMGDVAGKDVLCLAGGGGQQSAAFALLGANVTVFDLSEMQLQRDREAAAHYGLEVATVQGDMRDLSCFADAAFDVVWHAHSLNFVPDPRPVFDEAARVLQAGGLYYLHCLNPAYHGMEAAEWTGRGYPMRVPYVDGAEMVRDDPHWTISDEAGGERRVKGPREFRHALSAIINGLIERGFIILGIWEDFADADPNAEHGTWRHFTSVAPPYLALWATYRPDVAAKVK